MASGSRCATSRTVSTTESGSAVEDVGGELGGVANGLGIGGCGEGIGATPGRCARAASGRP